jgi:DNA-directed RNA polymerase I, II, and III subunit RPABC2
MSDIESDNEIKEDNETYEKSTLKPEYDSEVGSDNEQIDEIDSYGDGDEEQDIEEQYEDDDIGDVDNNEEDIKQQTDKLDNNLSSIDKESINYSDNIILSNDNLHKFDKDVKTDYVLQEHSETIKIDNATLSKYLNITRDNNGNIVDNFHKTIPILTKFELTKVLGLRVKQLNTNSKPYIKINENITDNYSIANLELRQHMLPFIIKRPLPNNTFEYWKLSDLQII